MPTSTNTRSISGWNFVRDAALKRVGVLHPNTRDRAAVLCSIIAVPYKVFVSWGQGDSRPTPRAVIAMRRVIEPQQAAPEARRRVIERGPAGPAGLTGRQGCRWKKSAKALRRADRGRYGKRKRMWRSW